MVSAVRPTPEIVGTTAPWRIAMTGAGFTSPAPRTRSDRPGPRLPRVAHRRPPPRRWRHHGRRRPACRRDRASATCRCTRNESAPIRPRRASRRAPATGSRRDARFATRSPRRPQEIPPTLNRNVPEPPGAVPRRHAMASRRAVRGSIARTPGIWLTQSTTTCRSSSGVSGEKNRMRCMGHFVGGSFLAATHEPVYNPK